jgi:hypothetical protein
MNLNFSIGAWTGTEKPADFPTQNCDGMIVWPNNFVRTHLINYFRAAISAFGLRLSGLRLTYRRRSMLASARVGSARNLKFRSEFIYKMGSRKIPGFYVESRVPTDKFRLNPSTAMSGPCRGPVGRSLNPFPRLEFFPGRSKAGSRRRRSPLPGTLPAAGAFWF